MIADPMADLTGGSAAQPDANHNGNSKEVLDPIAMQSNMMRIERIRSVMGIAAGCVAGIGGLTSWEGLSTCSPSKLELAQPWSRLFFYSSLLTGACTVFVCSLLFDFACFRMCGSLGLEDEVPTAIVHQALVVWLLDYVDPTDGLVVYSVLDALLRSRVFVLKLYLFYGSCISIKALPL
jgi:hypothetical protein